MVLVKWDIIMRKLNIQSCFVSQFTVFMFTHAQSFISTCAFTFDHQMCLFTHHPKAPLSVFAAATQFPYKD